MQPEEVLSFWFGALDAEGFADAAHRKQWFVKDPAFDAEIRRRFLGIYDDLRAGKHASAWQDEARSALAAIIVLDQFPRNMFRGSARMYESDALAQDRADALLEASLDEVLPSDMKVFAAMPLMHSEALPRQERCVAYFEALVAKLEGDARERVAFNLKFAEQHRDIVAQWGRFPHRNVLLGRPSTPEERAFLQTEGSSF